MPELCLVCPVLHALWQPLAVLPRLMWRTEAAIQAAALRQKLTLPSLPPDKWVASGLPPSGALPAGSNAPRFCLTQAGLGRGWGLGWAMGRGGGGQQPPCPSAAWLLHTHSFSHPACCFACAIQCRSSLHVMLSFKLQKVGNGWLC